jgi:hypothetical protein
MTPNKAPEPTPIGRRSSASRFTILGWAWLSFIRWTALIFSQFVAYCAECDFGGYLATFAIPPSSAVELTRRLEFGRFLVVFTKPSNNALQRTTGALFRFRAFIFYHIFLSAQRHCRQWSLSLIR